MKKIDRILKNLLKRLCFTFGIGYSLIALLIVGCNSEGLAETNVNIVSQGVHNIKVVNVDGCEYVLFRPYEGGGLTHKGNCKNPIHL